MSKRDIIFTATSADGADTCNWLLGVPANMSAEQLMKPLINAVTQDLGEDEFLQRFGPKSIDVKSEEDGATVTLAMPNFEVEEFDPANDLHVKLQQQAAA